MDPLPAGSQAPRFAATWASVSFDLLRGMAAFLVLYEHWRALWFVDFPDIAQHRLALFLPYLLGTAGHDAVVVFFVLSGYFIGGTVFGALERKQWDWNAYLLRRFARLWMVLLPGLLLCLFWDRLGIHLGRAPALYGGQIANHMLSNVPELLSPHIFLGNLFFLQGIVTPVFGSDGALWSLAYEFWYYLLFPLVLIVFWKKVRWWHRLLCAGLALLIARLVGSAILIDFPIWLAGALLFKMSPPAFSIRKGKYVRLIAMLVYGVAFIGFGRLPGLQHNVADYVLTALTVPFLWILLSDRRRYEPTARSVVCCREFARFSFTLYVAHVPFLVFLTSLIAGDSRSYPTPARICEGLLVLMAALGYAYGLAFLTEFRTDVVRQWLERRVGMASPPARLPSNPLSAEAG